MLKACYITNHNYSVCDYHTTSYTHSTTPTHLATLVPGLNEYSTTTFINELSVVFNTC